MLTFKGTTFFIILALALYAISGYFFGLPFYGYIVLLVCYLFVLFLGSYRVGSGFYMKVVCSGPRDKKQVAITFDDGPDKVLTPRILEILRLHQVKATFFCIGRNVAAHPEILHRIHNEGHIIGNHSYAHGFWFDLQSSRKMEADLKQMHALVQETTGLRMRYFRPPYGVTNPNLKKAVEALQYEALGWNIRSMDTVLNDSEKLLHRMKQALKPGAIYLFHDSSLATADMLSALLKYIREEDYEAISLETLTGLKPYSD
jgi:peptidoglycan/xylan/chitin deacetylase (PgdA/CDA1 family)